jgi:hypothetical protein
MIILMTSARKTQQARKAARFISSYRFEIAIFVAPFVLFWMATSLPLWISIPWFLALIGLVIWQRKLALKRAKEMQCKSKIKRELVRAARDSGFGELYVDKVELTLPGERALVHVPRGATVKSLVQRADAMAGCLKAKDVLIVPGENQSLASVSIIRRDPLLDMAGEQWPLLHAKTVNIRKGVPFGLDQYGDTFMARLLSTNIIMGGAPNAGKSAALRLIIGAGVLDPKVKVWLMDGKQEGAEFIHWTSAAHRLIRGRQLEKAVEMLAELEERVEERSREIVARGEVFVCEDMEIDLLVIDEIPQFMRSFEKDSKSEQAAVKTIREAIWRLIALGRWAGMITVLSAQKPTADIVPSESRDLIDHKYALHCNTAPMLKAILGDNAGEESIEVNDIPPGQPGLGWYFGDNGYTKIRNFFISHQQALEIASRASSRQLDEELAREFA